jgi:hypothetical protein
MLWAQNPSFQEGMPAAQTIPGATFVRMLVLVVAISCTVWISEIVKAAAKRFDFVSPGES